MKPKLLLSLVVSASIMMACKNSANVGKTFCDTSCFNDTLKFELYTPEKPYVYISMKDCVPDTVIWSHKNMATNLKIDFNSLAGSGIRLNKKYISCYFRDTSYAWLEFNDCLNGRGYLLRLNFNKKEGRDKYSSALTRFDPKYKIGDGLICYADYSFLYVSDIYSGKTEKILLADHELKIDYNNIHATFDSVNVSRNRIFINLIEDGQKKTLEKKIIL